MILLFAFLLAACQSPDAPPSAQPPDTTQAAVLTGAQWLVDEDFQSLAGWRVGLITNHTARVDTADGGPVHLIDRLYAAPNVTLAALFAPEHGLRGTTEAGDRVTNDRDAVTGVPVYSLYGERRRGHSQCPGSDSQHDRHARAPGSGLWVQ